LALNISAAYPGQVSTTDPSGYPWGRPRNDIVVGAGNGFPLEEQWVSDVIGFEQALLSAASLTPSGTPDKVGASQYLDALRIVDRIERQKAQAQNWTERASFHNAGDSATPDGKLGLAWAPDLGVANPGGRYVLIGPSSTAGCNSWSTEDGTNWEFAGLLSAAEASNPCVAYGKIGGASGYLATYAAPVGYYTSTTGTAWGTNSATVPAAGAACYAPSLALWVIAGTSGAISTSPTGLPGSWTARSAPAGWVSNCGGAKRAIWTGANFIVLPLASYNKCLTSPDGVNWTERTMPTTGVWSGVAYSSTDSLVMATNLSNSAPSISADGGLTWTSAAGAGWFLGNDVAVQGSLWVVPTLIGNAGGILYSVDKGASWNRVTVGNHRVAVQGWNRIIVGENRFMIAHATGAANEVALSARAL